MNAKDYDSVMRQMRLDDGTLWPVPILLRVTEENAAAAQEAGTVHLIDDEGIIIAEMEVEDVFDTVSPEAEGAAVAGTSDDNHPHVAFLHTCPRKAIGGKVELVRGLVHHTFSDLRKTPAETKEMVAKYERVIGFQTRNPLHRAHVELMLRCAIQSQAHILLHPTVGLTQPGDVDPGTRVRCYKHCIQEMPADIATLAVFPLAMRMLGPREALWHALIRKNYGCTHFIVGRDHAGPSPKRKDGQPFYDAYAAQVICETHEKEIGMTIVASPEIVYCPERGQYVIQSELLEGETSASISGTQLRKALVDNAEIPDWFSYPGVLRELRRASSFTRLGVCVAIVGLSGAGKSTLARALKAKLQEEDGDPVSLLDADVARRHLSSELGFSKEHRSLNVRRFGYVASEIVRHNGVVICTNIAPYEEDRQFNRSLVQQHGGYLEVFVDTPIEVCESRDPKGMYAKARQGRIGQFTGVSDAYERPTNPDIRITPDTKVEDAVKIIMESIALYHPRHQKRSGFRVTD